MPTVGTMTNNASVSNITSRYGLPSAGGPTTTNGIPGGGSKPFSGYTPPSGYSPWMGLYQPTSNGAADPYTTYVQPALSQQNFNAHVSEQINGVRTLQQGYGAGTPGMEVNSGGNGLVNPAQFLNYGTYYPSSTPANNSGGYPTGYSNGYPNSYPAGYPRY